MSDTTETHVNYEAEEIIQTLSDIGQRMNGVGNNSDEHTRLRIISVANNIGRIARDMEAGIQIKQGN